MSYLIDTNVLGRIVQKTHPMHADAVNAVRELRKRKESLFIVPQNLIELWVVATRPTANNRFGITADEAAKELRKLKRLFPVRLDSATIFTDWENLVKQYQVTGKPAHDAHLVAAMHSHGITHLLTFNKRDFTRYNGITVMSPQEVTGAIQ